MSETDGPLELNPTYWMNFVHDVSMELSAEFDYWLVIAGIVDGLRAPIALLETNLIDEIIQRISTPNGICFSIV